MKIKNLLFTLLFLLSVKLSTAQTWTTYGLANSTVRSVAIDVEGNKWFGTNGGGVSKFNGTTWTTYNTTNGLANNVVYSIATKLRSQIVRSN